MTAQPQGKPETCLPPWRTVIDRINGNLLRFGNEVPEPWDFKPFPPMALDDEGYLISSFLPKTERYMRRMLAYFSVLKYRYTGHGGTVGADLSMPYAKGCPGKMVAPDLFVALAAEERQRGHGRDNYRLWDEPVPDFIFDDLSPGNWRPDAVDKRVLYRRWGVREYWMFDETRTRLPDDSAAMPEDLLVGYQLSEVGYTPIHPNAAGRLPSAVLGLELAIRDGLLRFFDPAAGEYLRTLEESNRAREAIEREAEEAERQADEAKRRADEAKRRADEAKQLLATVRRERKAAQARVAELEAKLKALRSE